MLPADAQANTKKWQKPVHDIQVNRVEWNDKMKKYEEKRYSEKKLLNISTEERKFADIEFLKKILLALSPVLMKYLITWAVITMMLSRISGFTLKSDWLKEHAFY